MSDVIIHVNPIGKPRQTRSDKWKKRPAVLAYRAFADQMRAAVSRSGFVVPESGLEVTFFIGMPASWSKKKRHAMYLEPHRQKPDIDNLLKSVLDSLCAEDCTVWNIRSVSKYWALQGYIRLSRSA